MDLTLTEEQEMIASTAREFLEARCPMSHVIAMEDDAVGYSRELWREMAELGWTGLSFPEEHGGFGAGFTELCLIVEEMGRFLLPGPFLETVAMCGPAVSAHGSDEQKESFLGAISSGETVMSYARAAPGAGWPDRGSEVLATSDGDDFLLSGTAMFVPFAHAVDRLMVVARNDGGAEDDLTVLVVDTGMEGVSSEALETVYPGHHHHRVGFSDVRVSGDAVIGDVGGGDAVTATVAAHGAAATCAAMVGGAQRVLDMTVQYATEREQFGSPIGSFQAIQHQCADMGVDVLSSRLLAFEAIWRLDEGLDASHEISMAKAWVSEAYRRVVASGHQVHGAIGFTQEHELHRYFRHAVASELAFGDGDHHWALVADDLGLPTPA